MLVLVFCRFLALGAYTTTAVCCILTIAQMVKDVDSNAVPCHAAADTAVGVDRDPFQPHFPSVALSEAVGAFGSIMFSFGGASTFPTVMVDMKKKSDFKYAALIALLSMSFNKRL